jgi:hypothetical protein
MWGGGFLGHRHQEARKKDPRFSDQYFQKGEIMSSIKEPDYEWIGCAAWAFWKERKRKRGCARMNGAPLMLIASMSDEFDYGVFEGGRSSIASFFDAGYSLVFEVGNVLSEYGLLKSKRRQRQKALYWKEPPGENCPLDRERRRALGKSVYEMVRKQAMMNTLRFRGARTMALTVLAVLAERENPRATFEEIVSESGCDKGSDALSRALEELVSDGIVEVSASDEGEVIYSLPLAGSGKNQKGEEG